MNQKLNNEKFTYEICDVSLKSSIENFSIRLDHKIDVLINNAAISSNTRSETSEKIETQWATNVLGYYWMIYYLNKYSKFNKSDQIINITYNNLEYKYNKKYYPRVILVAGKRSGGLDLNDVEFRDTNRAFDAMPVYQTHKQAVRMLVVKLAQAFPEVYTNAVHPGICTSNVSLGMGIDSDRTEEARVGCARNIVSLAVQGNDDGAPMSSGKFYMLDKLAECEFAQNYGDIEQLWQVVNSYI
eukprot:Mrub_08210.p1 GENE.Mrub_08210~~Mrub_08210.p1  ORF type:complete len:274 (+),score=48.70 Mrub_08210:98-823(+)